MLREPGKRESQDLQFGKGSARCEQIGVVATGHRSLIYHYLEFDTVTVYIGFDSM